MRYVLEAKGQHEYVYFAGTIVPAGRDLVAEVVYRQEKAAIYGSAEKAREVCDAINAACAIYTFGTRLLREESGR